MQIDLIPIETGGRNDFGTNELIQTPPIGGGENCKVCGEIVPDEKVQDIRVGSNKDEVTVVFACKECRLKMEKLDHDSKWLDCPNCHGHSEYYPDGHFHYLRFTGHEEFSKTPTIKICKDCFNRYEALGDG